MHKHLLLHLVVQQECWVAMSIACTAPISALIPRKFFVRDGHQQRMFAIISLCFWNYRYLSRTDCRWFSLTSYLNLYTYSCMCMWIHHSNIHKTILNYNVASYRFLFMKNPPKASAQHETCKTSKKHLFWSRRIVLLCSLTH